MKWLNGNRMRLAVVGFVAVMAFSDGSVKADFTFGEPVNLGPTVNTPQSWSGEPAISADGMELYFISERPGGQGAGDVWVTTRSAKDDPWGQPVNLGPVINSPVDERGPCIADDGLELYFVSKISGKWYIYVSTRQSKTGEWGTPVILPNNPPFGVDSASVSGDGLELYYSFYYNDGWYEIHVMKRTTTNETWPPGERLGSSVNAWNNDMASCVSYDGSALFYARGGGEASQYELMMSTRTSTNNSWTQCIRLDAINSSGWDYAPCVSADGTMLYFESDRPGCIGVDDIWQAPIIPIVDFNADGIVDSADMCIMVDHWGTDNSLCDIGPMPWGDGVVDVQDLKVLAEHLFREVNDPTLVVHWPLDETEGMVVHDTVGDNQAFAVGDPVWQPDGGQVGGALQFDGVDDFVSTPAVLNPSAGPFSLVAWIKGGAPGQVVVSQIGKANWLGADPSEGTLMTELTVAGRNSRSLASEAVITDGNWHRIGFVWDGSYRRLYVDGIVVAEDEQDNLDISVNGLYFGTGKTMMEPGTFFSGLLDDVRIYNRAVKP